MRVSAPLGAEFKDLCRMCETRFREDWDWDRDSVTLMDEPEEVDYTDHMWVVSDISKPVVDSDLDLEFKDTNNEQHYFRLVVTADRVVFGGMTNSGFLESGYLKREEGENAGDGIQAVANELSLYYNEGPQACARIVCNERM